MRRKKRQIDYGLKDQIRGDRSTFRRCLNLKEKGDKNKIKEEGKENIKEKCINRLAMSLFVRWGGSSSTSS